MDWCWSWNSNTLATSCEELTHWKRPWCWEVLVAGGEGDNGGWDGWMASPTAWAWVWVNSGSWWWTGRPCVLWFMGSQSVGHDWATELNWTELIHRWYTVFVLLWHISLSIMPSKSIPVAANGKILFFLINYHIYSTISINIYLELKKWKKHKIKFMKFLRHKFPWNDILKVRVYFWSPFNLASDFFSDYFLHQEACSERD